MNCKQARAKLDSVSKSIAIKHPKVLIAELCVVVKFLLDELDRIKSPPEDFEVKRSPNIQPPWPDRPRHDTPEYKPPIKSPSINPLHPYRKGNAGDAE